MLLLSGFTEAGLSWPAPATTLVVADLHIFDLGHAYLHNVVLNVFLISSMGTEPRLTNASSPIGSSVRTGGEISATER